MRTTDLLSTIEAAYRVEASDAEWLAGLAAACLPVLDRGLGICAFEFHYRVGDTPRILQAQMLGMPEELARLYPTVFRSMPPEIQIRPFLAGPCTTASQMMGEASHFKKNELMQRYAQKFGMYDSIWITAAEPSGWGCGLHAGRPQVGRASRGTIARWARIAAHFAAAARLRRTFPRSPRSPLPVLGSAAAVFSTNGKVHHAEGEAKEAQAIERLRQSVLDIEKARRHRSEDASKGLFRWRALVDGRWSLVDRFESDSRRYVVARENPPNPPGIEGLSLRERQVVAYAALGHDNKVIAYDLGIAHSTVRVLMARAAAKLNVTTREKLVAAYRDQCHRV